MEETKALKPLKVIIHGPPASGKTKLSEMLCRHYGAHYVSVKSMIEETLHELEDNIEKAREKLRQREKKAAKEKKDEEGEETDEVEEEEEELEEEVEDDLDIEDWQEQVKDITTSMAKNANHKLPDQYLVRLMKTFLTKEVCQTRGYVLDGYPKTTQQAKELFGQAAEAGKVEEEGKLGIELAGEGALGEDQEQVGNLAGNANEAIMPSFVVSLEASDDFLCERVMRLPQRLIQGTHYDEVEMLRRLAEFRSNNTESSTVLQFFDEAEIHPILVTMIDEETEKERDLDCIFSYLCEIFGEPIPGFGLSPEEEDALRKLERERRRLQEEEGMLEKNLLEEKATKDHQDKMERWAEAFEKLQQEEEKILAAQSEPLRFYLMKYIFPTLSKGLIEVAKLKPDDPIDFLAEFLFRENPEGKMFDPSYTRQGEKILKQFEKDVQPSLSEM